MELVFVRYDDFVLLCSRNLCLLSACGARQKIIRARCDDEEKKMIYQRWKKAYYFLFRECRPWNDNILSIYSALPNNTFFNARGRNKRVYHIRARAPFFFFINYARARDTVYSRGNGVNDTLNEFRQRVYILRVYTHVYVIDGTKYIRLFLTFLRSPFFIHTPEYSNKTQCRIPALLHVRTQKQLFRALLPQKHPSLRHHDFFSLRTSVARCV